MVKPFIKWSGIKPQHIGCVDSVISPNYTYKDFTLVVPEVGSGNILFYMLENYSNITNCIITDSNKELANLYNVFKSDVAYEELKQHLKELEEFYKSAVDKKYQFNVFRYAYNGMITEKTSGTSSLIAALFIFLNKICYNGIYRVNSKGEFNSAWSSKEQSEITFFDEDFDRIHLLMKNVMVYHCKLDEVDDLIYGDNVLVVADSTSIGTEAKEFVDRMSDKGFDFVYVCDGDTAELYRNNIYTVEPIMCSDNSLVYNYTVNGRLF